MAENVLVTRGLTKKYGSHTAVDQANITIPKGEIYGLVGRNGAGKTTIIRMVTAQTVPTAGEIELFGATGERELQRARSHTGAMVEIPSFYPYLTARENLEYYRRQRGVAGGHVVDDALEQVGLADTGKKKFNAFSLGMKQRLGIAMALAREPKLLILDEPTNGLDPAGIEEMRGLIKTLPSKYGMTVMISSHILSEIDQMATVIGIINQGSLIFQERMSVLDEQRKPQIILKTSDDDTAYRFLAKLNPQRTLNGLQLGALTDEQTGAVVRELCSNNLSVYRVEEHRESLEDIFLTLTGKELTL